MRSDVDVSVIVPIYNTRRFVDQALASAEQNTLCNLEIIAINDGSTDHSLSIVRRRAARDRRYRVIDKPNEGYGATVNRGIQEARGDYVCILEPDDWVLPGAYDRLYGIARAFGDPDVVKSSYWRVLSRDGADDLMAHGYLHGRVRKVATPIRLTDEPQLIQYHPSIWSALYARDFLEREAIRLREVPGAGWVDNPFCVETLAVARSIVYVDDAFYCYREDLSTASSAHANARLMLDRWHDRQDVLDNRGVDDPSIRRANAVVGLRYLASMMSTDALVDPSIRNDARRMVERMGNNTLDGIDCIHPKVLTYAHELAGLEALPPSKLPYITHLAQEAGWALKNNGPRFLLHNIALARNHTS